MRIRSSQRIAAAGVVVAALMAGAAQAQTPVPTPSRGAGGAPASEPDRGYVEGIAQSAFGNVTSQSYGGEIGVTIRPRIQVFLEGGRIRDTAPATLGAGAQKIAGFLNDTQGGASFVARAPVTFGALGVRYLFPTQSQAKPYVVGGVGIAQVKQDVHFTLNGTDVTGTLPQYGVALGSDLSGQENKAMLVAGAGVVWTVWKPLFVDLQYRYGRIFTSEGINVSRAGIGVGVRF